MVLRTLSILAVLALTGCTGTGRPSVGLTKSTMDDVLPTLQETSTSAPGTHDLELPSKEAAQVALKAGDELARRGFTIEAIHQYEQARTKDSQVDVSHRLAVAYARAGQDERAATEFGVALKKHPKQAQIWNDAGYFSIHQSDWTTAEHQLTQAVTLDPGLKTAWCNLALVYAHTDRIDKARETYQRFLTPTETTYNLAVVLAGQGRGEEAQQMLQAILDRDPGAVMARNLLQKLNASSSAATPQTVAGTR